MSVGTILLFGMFLGVRHALDADHLAAVATLVTRSRSMGNTVLHGLAWGAGHTLTLLLVGGAVLAFDLVLPERAALALEVVVGVMLIGLGADVLRRLWRGRAHLHAQRPADSGRRPDALPYRHQDDRRDPEPRERGGQFPLRALLVGMVHGMAGSAALILLSLEATRSPAWGVAYIALFGLGSIVGMAALSALIAVPLRLTSHHLARTRSGMTAIIGVATVMLGCHVVYQAGGAMA